MPLPGSVTCEFPDGTQCVISVEEKDTVESLKSKAFRAEPKKMPEILRKHCTKLQLEGGDVCDDATPLADLPLEADSKVQVRVTVPDSIASCSNILRRDGPCSRDFEEGEGVQWWDVAHECSQLTTIRKSQFQGADVFAVFYGTHDYKPGGVSSELVGMFDTWEEAFTEAIRSNYCHEGDNDSDESDESEPQTRLRLRMPRATRARMTRVRLRRECRE